MHYLTQWSRYISATTGSSTFPACKMDEDDAYEWTEADMLDTLQLVVAAEQQSAVEALETPPSGSQAARNSHSNQDNESSSALTTEGIRASKRPVVRRQSSVSVRDSESSSSSPSMSTTQKRQPFYHARQKQELEYLKSKVRELERDLLRIEQENEAKLAEDSDSIWQRMARQQNVGRQKALSENVRLKELLEDQIQFARSLEKVIRKRPNLSALSGAQGSDRPTRRRKKAHTFASLYDEFSEDANRRYQRMDDVFQYMGVLDLVKEYRSLNLKVYDEANAESDVCVEQILVRRYPFSFREVGQELWNFLSIGSNLEQTGDVKREVDQTDDSLFATTTVKFPVGNRFCELTASALLRLFVEEDSYTVVWVSEGECAPPRSAKNSFKLSEHGWINIRPIISEDASAACVCRTVGFYTPTLSERNKQASPSSSSENDSSPSPVHESIAPENSEEIGILTELLSTVYQRTIVQIHTMIENTLMEKALRDKSVDNQRH